MEKESATQTIPKEDKASEIASSMSEIDIQTLPIIIEQDGVWHEVIVYPEENLMDDPKDGNLNNSKETVKNNNKEFDFEDLLLDEMTVDNFR